MTDKKMLARNLMSELGVSGLKTTGGLITEEFLPQVAGKRGIRIYKEMSSNDSIISSILFAIEMMVRAVEWRVIPDRIGKYIANEARMKPQPRPQGLGQGQQAEQERAQGKEQEKEPAEEEEKKINKLLGEGVASASPDEQKAIAFIEGVLFKDMDHTWDDFLAEVMSMITYGWSLHEIVFKIRNGEDSEFDDGKIGIKKLPIRSQDTLHKWEFDGYGGISGIWQYTDASFDSRSKRNLPPTIFIPFEKCLLFRPRMYKNSPEGRSVLRNAYRSWYMLKRLQEIESIGIERELNGIPVAYIPMEVMGSSDADDVACVTEYRRIVRDVRFNEQGGIVLPSDPFVNEDGSYTDMPLVRLELLASKGTRNIDTNEVIGRYAQDIARTVLADFLMLGARDQGSFALSRSKVDIFLRAMRGWLESVAAVINRNLVTKLWQVNGFDEDTKPMVFPGRIAPENLDELGSYIDRLARAGMPLFPDDDLENVLRESAGLPDRAPYVEGEY